MGKKVEAVVFGAVLVFSAWWIGKSYFVEYKESQREPIVDQLGSEGSGLSELDSICSELKSLNEESVANLSDFRLSTLLRRCSECDSIDVQQVLVAAEQSKRDLKKAKDRASKATIRRVTIDGYDKEAGLIVDPVNVWKSYTKRTSGIAGTVSHGDHVKMLDRSGDGVLIESSSGVRGWVGFYFIKELK